MAIDVQAEALRRKSAGDPRPLAMIVAELSAAPQASMAPAPQAMTPTPGQPVPVGEQVNIQTPAPAPQQAAVPPMTTPFNPVDKARSAAAPKVEQIAETSATDAGIQQAKQQGKPQASMMEQAAASRKAAYEEALAERQLIRNTIGVPERLEKVFAKQDERAAKEEADIAADEKKQVWNALAMAGFQMAQSTSPYFLAALAAGMESGLKGYDASQAALAERKARNMDAKERIDLERYKVEKAAENEELANMDAARSTAYRQQEADLRYLEGLMAQDLHPDKKAQIRAQIDQIRANIANDRARLGLAYRADARAAAAARGAGDPLAKARNAVLGTASEYGRKYATDRLEAERVRMNDPTYREKFELYSGEGTDMWINTNPNAKAVLGAGATAIKTPPPPPAPPKKEEEKGWFSRLIGG